MIIDKSLYGLKTSSTRFHECLSEKLKLMGYKPSKVYPDLWYKQMESHYEYIARYEDDVISFSKDPLSIIEELKKTYGMKPIGAPECYLGGNVIQLGEEWEKEGINTALSAETCIENNIVQKLAAMVGIEEFSKSRYKAPMSEDYYLELDESDLCSPLEASKYRSLIGSTNWIVALGRFDIAFTTSNLARYSTVPKQGHYKAAQRIFDYLRHFPKGRILIDSEVLPIRNFIKYEKSDNWNEFYPEEEDDTPKDSLDPLGTSSTVTCYVDADHARDKVTCRSVTGILLCVNNTPVIWYTKRQNTVETSTYGSELVATRVADELVMEYRYKLRMLGVSLEETSLLIGDNMSIILNTTLPSSMLKKKHNAIVYHRVREAIAVKIINFVHIDSKLNIADILTKPLTTELFYSCLKDYMFRKPTVVPIEAETASQAGLLSKCRF